MQKFKTEPIWERASGNGAIVNNLRKNDFTSANASDLYRGDTRLDFPTQAPPMDVTNPPHSDLGSIHFIKRCIELKKSFAMLIPCNSVINKSFSEVAVGHYFQFFITHLRKFRNTDGKETDVVPHGVG
ncbi:hypothetical protein EON65_43595 [archaeon]|nr:MAG: hypothetical protein EON65_43595 [archaeon]